MINRRRFTQTLLGGTALLGLSNSHFAYGQTLELAKILVGFSAGGMSDALARRVGEKMTGRYASKIIVENKTGAGGQIAVVALKDSPADGATLMLAPASLLTIYPYTYAKLPYRPADDTTPVSVGAYFSTGLGVGPMVPESVKNVKDFLVWAKANPDKASYGSPGAGSMPHLIAALVEMSSHVTLNHTPYRGSAPGIQDLLGGQIASMSSPIGDYLPHLKSGRLRLLAVAGEKRSAFAPDIPTYAEQGFAELTMREWFGFFLPGKAKREVVQYAFSAITTALQDKDVAESLAKLGLEVAYSPSSEDFARQVKAEQDVWAPFVKRIGFTADS
jgi:tripartite-type tricarboxylate transporter receptor subunit TctC